MSPLLAELFGTAILIVLGDGVVANAPVVRPKVAETALGRANAWESSARS